MHVSIQLVLTFDPQATGKGSIDSLLRHQFNREVARRKANTQSFMVLLQSSAYNIIYQD